MKSLITVDQVPLLHPGMLPCCGGGGGCVFQESQKLCCAGGSSLFLIGSPTPDWSCGEEPDEEHPPENGARGIEISPYPVGSPGYTKGPTLANGARVIEIGLYPFESPGYTNGTTPTSGPGV